MFDSTFFLFGGAAFLAYYRGDASKAARGMGYHVGRAVGFALHLRAKFLTNAPLWDLHKSLAQSVLELHSVRQDLQSVASGPFRPAPSSLDPPSSPSPATPPPPVPSPPSSGFAASHLAGLPSPPASEPIMKLYVPQNYVDISAADLRRREGGPTDEREGNALSRGGLDPTHETGSQILLRAMEEAAVAGHATLFVRAMTPPHANANANGKPPDSDS